MIISGTGHRPDKLGGYSDDVLVKLKTLAIDLIPEDTTKIITGMALGWDTALALAAIWRHIPFVAAVPFLGQEKMWPKESQTRYHNLLGAAEDVVYVCDQGYAPWKMQIRNEYMVDHCDTVLALWDGSAGGTSNCVKYAEKKGKPIINIWKHWEGNT